MARTATAKTDKLVIPPFLLRKKTKGLSTVMAEDLTSEQLDWDDSPLPEGLEWVLTWWMNGQNPDRNDDRLKFFVKDPPCNGWGHAFIIRGENRSTVFCPYSMKSWAVPNWAGEVCVAKDASKDFRCGFMIRLITSKWEYHQSLGMQADYDIAAVVLKKLGAKIPTRIELTEERRAELTRLRPQLAKKKEGPSGGKEPADKVLKPVVKASKRGKVLAFFLKEGKDKAQSIREAMAEFDTTRSNILSTLFILNKDHGLGYILRDDTALVTVPKGKLWT